VTLKLAEPNAPPAFTRPPEGAEDQLQALLLSSETGDDLGPAAFFLESTLDEVGGPDMPSMNGRELEVSQAGRKIVGQAPHGRGIAADELGQDPLGMALPRRGL